MNERQRERVNVNKNVALGFRTRETAVSIWKV